MLPKEYIESHNKLNQLKADLDKVVSQLGEIGVTIEYNVNIDGFLKTTRAMIFTSAYIFPQNQLILGAK